MAETYRVDGKSLNRICELNSENFNVFLNSTGDMEKLHKSMAAGIQSSQITETWAVRAGREWTGVDYWGPWPEKKEGDSQGKEEKGKLK